MTDHPLHIVLGSIVNNAYQCGMDEITCRTIALDIRASLPEYERDGFTDAVEMCGLWLDDVPEVAA